MSVVEIKNGIAKLKVTRHDEESIDRSGNIRRDGRIRGTRYY